MPDNVPKNIPGPIVFVREAVDDLAAYLAMWDARKPLPQADAPARAAGSMALERIDSALRRLHDIRARLVDEIVIEDRAWLRLDEPEA